MKVFFFPLNPMRYRFYTLDVFTDQRFGGNPLAVVLDADALTTERMQAIAAEFNLSETVFVVKPAESGPNRCKLRIFTPKVELPFAGHPTIGASYLLATRKLVELSPTAPDLVLEEGIGDVTVEVQFAGGVALATRMSVPRMPERGPQAPPAADLAAMLGLAESEVLPAPAAYSCGVPFLFVAVRSRVAIAKIRLRADRWDQLLSTWWARSIFAFTSETVDPDVQIHARMFAPAMGVAEDPATGSAASALAGYLHEQVPFEGRRRWIIEQGVEMGRPSLLELEAEATDGRVTAVRVGGRSVLVSAGWVDVG